MLKKYALSALVIALLTACSGGGSSGSGSSSSAAKEEKSPLYTKQPVDVTINTENSDYSNDPNPPKMKWSGSSLSTAYGEKLEKIAESDTAMLEIDGKKIELNQGANLDWAGSAKLTYSLFGSYTDRIKKDNGGDLVSYAFSYGQVTPEANIPTKGSATYSGRAVYGAEDVGFTNADANFSVDFDKRTLSGKFENAAKGISLEIPTTEIKGASFTYNNRTDDDNGLQLDGRFYGPHADELGGVFTGEKAGKGFLGSFGAVKQKAADKGLGAQ